VFGVELINLQIDVLFAAYFFRKREALTAAGLVSIGVKSSPDKVEPAARI
jgi:hypothetical protein